MSIEIEELDEGSKDEWNRLVERSPQTTLFHQWDALEVQAAHTNTTIHPLVGYKGQEPVGLFPVFELTKGPFTAAFSPPPYLWVPKLGPAFLNMDKLKQRKAERRRRRFIDGCFEWIEDALGPRYVRTRTNNPLEDIRPFKWNGCTVTPEFTYITPLDGGEEDVLDRFSSDARSNIRTGMERSDEYVIEEEGSDAILYVMELVHERFAMQGESLSMPSTFPRDLYRELPDGQIRPYVLRLDGEIVSGILAYDYGGRVTRWQGGVKPDEDVDLPINDLLDWRVMADAIDRGRAGYDLSGAGNPRINRYKAKFGPELKRFYSVERSSPVMEALLGLYRTVSTLK